MRSPRRTASTATALMIGLGLVSMVAILAASLKASFDAALTDTLKADYTLSTSSFTSFSPEVGVRVASLPEVGTASAFRQNGFRVDGSTSFLTAVDPASVEAVATLEVVEGEVAGARRAATPCSSTGTSRRTTDGRSATTCRAEFASMGESPLTIVGIYDENRLVGDYVISLETYEGLYTEQLDTFVLVKASEGTPLDEAGAAIERCGRRVPERAGAGPGGVPGAAGRLRGPVAGARDGAAGDGDRDRPVRHREHAGPVDLRADPRARAAASRGHEPRAGQADDPVGVDHHRRASARSSASRSACCSAGRCNRRWRTKG